MKVVIPGHPAQRSRVIERVVCEARAKGFSDSDCFGISLALTEALTNAVEHGNRGDLARNVAIEYGVTADTVRISVRDEGRGFDPGSVPDPTLDENLAKLSGRGLMLMRSSMSRVRFNDQGNCVTMVKHKDRAGSIGFRTSARSA